MYARKYPVSGRQLLTAIQLILFSLIVFSAVSFGSTMKPFVDEAKIESVVREMTEARGMGDRDRIDRGVRQVARLWREDDGSLDDFAAFCKAHFISDPTLLQQTADRYESAFESVYGHFREMGRDLSWHTDIDTGPILPIDRLFARLSPGNHLDDDLFRTKIAFVALLNYPLYSLEERLDQGQSWTREQWAQARLVDRFATRVPPKVSQKISEAYVTADSYINAYNIYMHHLLAPNGDRLFPEGMRLISHWNLRDELKALYSEPDGQAGQEMIYQLMKKIIHQEIPEAVVNNPTVDWNLSTNEVTVSPTVDGEVPVGWDNPGDVGTQIDNSREPDTRYSHLLNMYHAQRLQDSYYPTMPTHMDRRFQLYAEIPEAEVERILTSVLRSPVIADVAEFIKQRLGRDLRPYDIWYDGFKARGSISEDELDRVVGEKYPTVESFDSDLPNILVKLGFDQATAEYLGSKIDVDPSRGPGHAMGPGRLVDNAHLRTRLPETGMDYKGYCIAIHEFGHNVEQVLSLNKVDHTLLRGVPNTAFTEGFAFVFQSRDLELLGLTEPDHTAEYMKALDVLWSTYEIGGVGLMDMRVWNWMYDNPDATPAELRDAVISIARGVWNEFFAPVFGMEDEALLSIYSHMIDNALYLPNYSLGHIIAFQIEEYMKDKNLVQEMERMCSLGSITPDLWMREAVGSPISTEPLLTAAEEALQALSR